MTVVDTMSSTESAIAVDSRYIHWVMQEAFPAPRVLEELGLPGAGE